MDVRPTSSESRRPIPGDSYYLLYRKVQTFYYFILLYVIKTSSWQVLKSLNDRRSIFFISESKLDLELIYAIGYMTAAVAMKKKKKKKKFLIRWPHNYWQGPWSKRKIENQVVEGNFV